MVSKTNPALSTAPDRPRQSHGPWRWSRRLLRWVGWTAVILFIIGSFVSMAMLFPVVQTLVAGMVGHFAREQFGIDLTIQQVAVKPFGPVHFRGILLRDLEGDTLIHADDLMVKGFRPAFGEHRISARSLRLDNARFRLVKAEGDSTSNLTRLLALFASEDTSTSRPWAISCRVIDVNGLHFTYDDDNKAHIPFGVDLDHVNVARADVHARAFKVAGDSVHTLLDHLSVDEMSGLHLQALHGLTTFSPRGIKIQDMSLRTMATDLSGQLAFVTNGLDDFDTFIDSVNMRLDLDSSRLQFADIAFFAPALEGIDLPITLSGRFRGTVKELKGRGVRMHWGRDSFFSGDADLSGLPGIDTTFIVLDAGSLRTDPADLAAIPVPPFKEKAKLSLPAEIVKLGPIQFSGNFTGFLNAFTAFGRTSTALGTVRTDMTFDRDTVSQVFHFEGRAITDGFDLGILVGDATLGLLACDVRLDARGRDMGHMKAGIEGTVPLLTFNRYRITGITVKGELEKDRFNGTLACRDPNLDMDFKGLADMSTHLRRSEARLYKVDFTADIRHADLHALNLVKEEGYSSLSVKVNARGEVAPDSLKGMLLFEDLWYCNEAAGDRSFGNVELRSSRKAGRPVLELRSDLADATVQGDFLPTRLPEAFRSVVFSVFPSLSDDVRYAQEKQNFDFDVHLKQMDPVLDLIAPGLDLVPGTTAKGWFDSRTFDLSLVADLPHVAFGGFAGDSVHIIVDKTLDVLAFSFMSERQMINDSTWIDGIGITGKAYQDEVEVSAGWSGSSSGTQGELELVGMVNGQRSIDIDLLPSQLWFGRGAWHNIRTAHLEWDSAVVRVDPLELWNEDQMIRLSGVVGAGAQDGLAFELDRVRLDNLAPYVRGPALHGLAGGDGRIFALLGEPYLLSYLCVDSLFVGKQAVGDLRFGATWNETDDAIDLSGSLLRGPAKVLDFTGNYAPRREDALDVRLTMDSFDLRIVEPYMPEGLSHVQGHVTGAVDMNGPLAAPRIAGSARLEDAGMQIDYLNTLFTFSHDVEIVDDMITLDNVLVSDGSGHTARLGGTIIHHGLQDWNFNVWGSMKDFLVLNTTAQDNSLYYGTAIATGTFEVSGYEGNLEVEVDATAARGTHIAMPLGGSTEVSGTDFVRFVSDGAPTDSLHEEMDLSGFAINMDVTVDPEARFDMIFDPTVGDVMSGSGEGHIKMGVTPAGDFSMLGGVTIVDGTYLFTLRNLVNKRFQVDPGGTITWYGDPFNATLDLDAVYRLRASLYDIMVPKDEAYKKRVPVDVVMHLSERLTNPTIGFDVRLPSVDENVRSVVNSVLNTEQERSRQVFALIAMQKFLAPESQGGGGVSLGGSGATTLAEFASTQLSNMFSKLSDNVDLGVNYRPGDNISREEWEVAVSTQLFNERLIVSTNLGVQYETGSSRAANQFAGDFQAEYLLTPEGRLRVKAYNQSNDENLNQAQKSAYTQGVGIGYRREMDHFWRDLFGSGRPPGQKKIDDQAPVKGEDSVPTSP